MDINIRRLDHHDIDTFISLIRLFEDVFEMKNFKMPDESYLRQLLDRDDFFAFVAMAGNKVAGGLTSYIMHQYYAAAPLVYIFDLAVKTELQRQGIGSMLIAANNSYSKTIGAEAVMVQADKADDYAIEFYHSTGAAAEEVIHFEYVLNNNEP